MDHGRRQLEPWPATSRERPVIVAALTYEIADRPALAVVLGCVACWVVIATLA